MPSLGFCALALDRDKRPLDVRSSNVGHRLWTGIVADEVACQVVEHLLSPAVVSAATAGTRSSGSARSCGSPTKASPCRVYAK
jgi:hypothetical protein